MRIGIIAGCTRYYGFKDKKVSDNNLKALCELLVQEHDVTLLTRVQEIEPFHPKLRYAPESEKGEFDVILMFGMLADIFIHQNLFRNLYVLLTHKADRYYDLLIDSSITSSYTFEYLNSKTEKSRFYDEQKMKKYAQYINPENQRYMQKVFSVLEFKQYILEKYEKIYNASEGYPSTFPFTFLDYPEIMKWKPRKNLLGVNDRNVYVGTYKPSRIKKLIDLGIDTDLYCDKLPRNVAHFRGMIRVPMSSLPEIYPQYIATIITTDKRHLKKGWILRRIAESIVCEVPVLIHEDFTKSMYGLTNVENFSWFRLTDEQIKVEFDRCKEKSYRERLVCEQQEALDTIMWDFNKNNLAKLTNIIENYV